MINSILSNLAMYQTYTNRNTTSYTQSTSFADTLSAKSLSSVSNGKTFNLYTDPDFIYAPQEPCGGCTSFSIANMLISVYKSANYSEENPVMRVKGINADGTHYEVEVNINDINPRNASLIELSAIKGHKIAKGERESGIPFVAHALTTQRLMGNMAYDNGYTDAFTKMDFIPAFIEMMETQRYHGNWDGYMRYKDIVDTLLSISVK